MKVVGGWRKTKAKALKGGGRGEKQNRFQAYSREERVYVCVNVLT